MPIPPTPRPPARGSSSRSASQTAPRRRARLTARPGLQGHPCPHPAAGSAETSLLPPRWVVRGHSGSTSQASSEPRALSPRHRGSPRRCGQGPRDREEPRSWGLLRTATPLPCHRGSAGPWRPSLAGSRWAARWPHVFCVVRRDSAVDLVDLAGRPVRPWAGLASPGSLPAAGHTRGRVRLRGWIAVQVACVSVGLSCLPPAQGLTGTSHAAFPAPPRPTAATRLAGLGNPTFPSTPGHLSAARGLERCRTRWVRPWP